MTTSIDTQQRLVEIEHALSRRFPSPSTAVAHVADSSNRMTVQVKWVAAAAETSVFDARCALDRVFAPGAVEHYASMDGAARVRVREALCEQAGETMNARFAHPDDVDSECHASMNVDQALLDRAADLPH